MTGATVGIVSWNTAELLDRCLSSLPAALDGLDAEVVVVDNASGDGSVDVARSHRGVVVVVNDHNAGYAAAMNRALARLPGSPRPAAEVLVALNPDTVAPPGSLAALAERLLAEPDVALVAPRLEYPGGGHQHSVYRFPGPAVSAAASFLPLRLQRGALGRRFALEASSPPREPVDVDWAIGAVHVVRSAALGGTAPYEERWFMYAEDLDLCWRLARSGWRCRYEPGISVVHAANAAGSQAWGPARAARWLAATYDWYGLRHGEAPMRRWAAVNAAGALARLAPAAARRAGRRPVAGWEADLPAALRTHLRVLAGKPLPAP